MPIFGFGDIKFDKNNGRRGPLGPLSSSDYTTSFTRYPSDLGSSDKGHYIIIYIREQKRTSYASTTPANEKVKTSVGNKPGGLAAASVDSGEMKASFGKELLDKVNSGLNKINTATGGALNGVTSAVQAGLPSLISGIGTVGSSIGNIFGSSGPTTQSLSGTSTQTQSVIKDSVKSITDTSLFTRTTKITKDAIALYMPETLLYGYTQNYADSNVGGEIGGKLLAMGESAVEGAKNNKESGGMGIAKAALPGIGTALAQKFIDVAGTLTGSKNTAQNAAMGLLGVVSNPLLEMIYSGPSFRSFQFDFMFYPRDEKEALNVQRIIETLTFHQAPEIFGGAFLVPPSEFDIKFYYSGKENPNIPKIAENCILKTIQVNYAPGGFAAYEVPGETASIGRTGMPVAIQVTLSFQETTYLTKDSFNHGLIGTAKTRQDSDVFFDTFTK